MPVLSWFQSVLWFLGPVQLLLFTATKNQAVPELHHGLYWEQAVFPGELCAPYLSGICADMAKLTSSQKHAEANWKHAEANFP